MASKKNDPLEDIDEQNKEESKRRKESNDDLKEHARITKLLNKQAARAQSKTVSSISKSAQLGDEQLKRVRNIGKQINKVSDITRSIAILEKQREDALVSNNTKEFKYAERQLQKQKELLAQNATYVTLFKERNELMKQEARKIIELGSEQSTLHKVTSHLNQSLVSTMESNRALSAAVDIVSEKFGKNLGKSVLLLGASAGAATALFKKYQGALIEATTALPAAMDSSGTIGKMVGLGELSLKTGLDFQQLSEQMKQNRVAWMNNSKEITDFIDTNESLRLRLGLTREEFADQAAVASMFLKRQGVDQASLSKETENYMVNLNKVAIQTNRQAKEVEESRRQAKLGAATFLATLSGEARTQFSNALGKLSDSSTEFGKQLTNMLSQGDVGTRLQEAGKIGESIMQLGKAAGWSGAEINKAMDVVQRAALGDQVAAQEMVKLNAKFSKDVGDAVASGKVVLDASFGGINEGTNDLVKSLMEQRVIGDSTGATLKELGKVGQTAANRMTAQADAAEGAFTWFSNLSKGMPIFGDITSGLFSFATGLAGVMPLMGPFSRLFGSIGGVFMKALPIVTRVFSLFTPVGLALTALSIAVPLIISNWDTIKEYFGKLVEWFGGLWSDASKWVDGISAPISDFFSNLFNQNFDISGMFSTYIITPFVDFFKKIGDAIFGGLDNIKSLVPKSVADFFGIGGTAVKTTSVPTQPITVPPPSTATKAVASMVTPAVMKQVPTSTAPIAPVVAKALPPIALPVNPAGTAPIVPDIKTPAAAPDLAEGKARLKVAGRDTIVVPIEKLDELIDTMLATHRKLEVIAVNTGNSVALQDSMNIKQERINKMTATQAFY